MTRVSRPVVVGGRHALMVVAASNPYKEAQSDEFLPDGAPNTVVSSASHPVGSFILYDAYYVRHGETRCYT